MPSNGETITEAIKNKKQLRGHCDGFYREMCPHALSWKGSEYHVLSYQSAGHSSRPLPVEGQWKCMDVDGISNLGMVDGPWHTGTSHTGPSTCFDLGRVEVEVDY